MFIQKKARKDADGAVIIGPRNFYTKRMRKGYADDVLFSKPGYNCLKDPYRPMTEKGQRTMVKDSYLIGKHEVDFKPAKVVHEKVPKAPYAYIPQGDDKAKKNYRDQEGAVITAPRNFTTTRLKVGKVGRGTTFSGPIPYMADDYNIASKLAKEETAYHRSKVQEKPFSSQAKRLPFGTFMNPREQFKHIPPPPEKPTLPKSESQALPPLHEAQFKPANPGKKHKSIGRFPAFMPDPPAERKRVKKTDEELNNEPPAFKPSKKIFSRPTPSIMTNVRNLKTAYPSHFRM